MFGKRPNPKTRELGHLRPFVQQFDAITDKCPSVAMAVMGTLAQRLREVQAA